MKRALFFPAIAAILAFALAASPALAKPKLVRYAPDNVNWYVEVDDWRSFVAGAKASPLAKIFETPELQPAAAELHLDAPSFKGTRLEEIILVDLGDLERRISGSVAVFNSHHGLMSEIEGAYLDETVPEAAQSTIHQDGVLMFEHDGSANKEILEMFKKAAEEAGPDPQRDRQRVGDATVHTVRVRKTVKTREVHFNENAPEDAPMRDRFHVVERDVTYENVYQYAVLDDAAFFGEGSNLPVTNALAAAFKTKTTLDKSDRFKRAMDAFREKDGTDKGLFFFSNFQSMHDNREREMEPAELAASETWGLRAFEFGAGRLYLSEDGDAMLDAYVGFREGAEGLAKLLDRLKPISSDAFAHFPSPAETAAAVGFDLGGALRDLFGLLEKSNPQAAMYRPMVTMQVQPMLGLDPFDEFLFLINGEHLFLEDTSSIVDWSPEALASEGGAWALALEVSGGARLAEAVRSLAEKAEETLGIPAGQIETQRFEGVDLHLMMSDSSGGADQGAPAAASKPIFALAVADKRLILSGRPELAKALLRSTSASGPEKPLSKDRAFRLAWRGVPSDCFAAQFASDIVMSPEEISNAGAFVLSTLGSMNLASEETLEKAFEKYQEQDINKEPLRLGASQIGYARRGSGFVHFRGSMVPGTAKASRDRE
jgi:hypothetical protein